MGNSQANEREPAAATGAAKASPESWTAGSNATVEMDGISAVRSGNGAVDSKGGMPAKACPLNGTVEVEETFRSGNGAVSASQDMPANVAGEANGNMPATASRPLQAMPLPAEKPRRPSFSLQVGLVMNLLPKYALVALGTITAFNIFAATTVASVPMAELVKSLIYMSPYTFLPIGVVGAVLASAASKSPQFVEASCGILLGELLYTILLGAAITIIKLEGGLVISLEQCWKSDSLEGCASIGVLAVAVLLCLLVIWVWSFVLSSLKSAGTDHLTAVEIASARAAASAGWAAKEAGAVPKTAREGADAAKRAADGAVAAEGASENAACAQQVPAAAVSASKL